MARQPRSLAGKVVVITGGGRGIGAATASALTRLGARCSPSHIHGINSVLNYMETGRWLRSMGFADPPRHQTREQLYAALGSKIEGERVLYLEFGVYYGVSMRLWSKSGNMNGPDHVRQRSVE